MKVIKFGGSSLANGEQLRKVLQIVKDDETRRIVVVSAPGKRNSQDEKVTDLLITLARQVIDEEDFEDTLNVILGRYQEIVDELNLDPDVMAEIRRYFQVMIQKKYPTAALLLDAFKASGEDNNARLVAAYFNQEGLPARYVSPLDAGIFVTDSPGNAFILPESYEFLYKLREYKEVVVLPGFFGYNAFGDIVTFSRGGSDITGAIVANGVKASLYENYTDVDAIYVANPKMVPHPKMIHHLTYREMRELSYSGFSVFHDEALRPAFIAGIPVLVKNTNNPAAKGTFISKTKPKSDQVVSGISSSSGFISIYISKYLMNREIGFGRRVLQIFEELGLTFEHMPSGIDELSVVLRKEQLTPGKQAALLYRLRTELLVDDVRINPEISLIMLVGEGMVASVGTMAKASKALADAEINIEMINQGSSEVSMMFGIREEDEIKGVQAIYHAFF